MVLDGVGKRYGHGPWVLDGLALALPPGSVTLVVGTNGSGKSTLLRILAGLSRATTGEVRGRPPTVAFAPERLAAQVRLTGASYLEHMGRMRGLAPGEVAARAGELFRRLRLSPGPGMPVRSLSKGNRQKVVVAQAFLAPVDLVVLDEPFTGLDPLARATVWELIGEARAGGSAVVLSAHLADDAVRTDRALILDCGRLHPVVVAADLSHRMRIQLAGAGDVTSLAAMPGVEVEATGFGARVADRTLLADGAGVADGGRRPRPSVGDAGRTVSLAVDGPLSDRTLARVLAEGWSVRWVTPLVAAAGGSDGPHPPAYSLPQAADTAVGSVDPIAPRRGGAVTNSIGPITGVVRYTLVDAIRAQRWIAPVVLFLAAVAIANSDAGPALTTYADTLTVLLPVGIWLTWSVLNAEDPVQADVSMVTVGNDLRYRLGKLAAAFLACAGLSVVAIATPVAVGAAGASAGSVARVLLEGLVGHVLVAALAVAVGGVTTRPVIGRLAEAFYVAITFTLAEIVIPGAPPVRQLLGAFDRDHPHHLAITLSIAGVETLALSAILVSIALAIARRRS